MTARRKKLRQEKNKRNKQAVLTMVRRKLERAYPVPINYEQNVALSASGLPTIPTDIMLVHRGYGPAVEQITKATQQ